MQYPTVTSTSTVQKIDKEILELNKSMKIMKLIDIYKISYPVAKYVFFSEAHGIPLK